MNPHTPPPPDDDDALAREEREFAALYRRLPQAEPDAALDAAVLAHASRAVEPSRRHALPRWAVALSSAAVLVLAAGLVWRLEFSQQQVAPVEAPAVSQQAPQGKPDAAATRDMASPSAEPVATPAPGRAPQPATARQMSPAVAPRQPAPRMREERERQAPTIVQQAQRLAAPPAKVLTAPPAKRAAAAAPRIVPSPVDEASTMALPPPPPAPAPPAAPALSSSKPAMLELREHPAAPTTVLTGTAKQDGTAASASAVSTRDDVATAPPAFTKRVEQIREVLHQGGSRDDARKAVHALQHDFPGVALPEDLRVLVDGEHP